MDKNTVQDILGYKQDKVLEHFNNSNLKQLVKAKDVLKILISFPTFLDEHLKDLIKNLNKTIY